MLKHILLEISTTLQTLIADVPLNDNRWIVHLEDDPTIVMGMTGRAGTVAGFAGTIPECYVHQMQDRQRTDPPDGYTSSRLIDWLRDASAYIQCTIENDGKGMVSEIKKEAPVADVKPVLIVEYTVNDDHHPYRYSMIIDGKTLYFDYFMDCTRDLVASKRIADAAYVQYDECLPVTGANT
mgnify:CR=1 FL=1